MQRAPAVMVAIVLAGCFHAGVVPRSARVLDQGDTVIGLNFTAAALSIASLVLDGKHVRGNGGQRASVHPLVAFLYGGVMNSQVFVRRGLRDGTEGALYLGWQESGLEVRQRAHDEVAISAAAMWRPWMDPRLPWLRAGVDLLGGDGGTSPVVDLYASWGPERHAFGVESALPPCRGFGGRGCGEYGPSRYLAVTRRELRLSAAGGVAIAGEPATTTLAVVPHVVLAAGAPYRIACPSCDKPFADVRLIDRWGVTATFGITSASKPSP
ncbi:MAG: hypothetical protein H6Q90_4057 [Deltaproteobacteria bacterium]|nr:hypothetical protein [Deltaproteobacteria bacterium]